MGPVQKVFLADGDALCIPQRRLEEILHAVNEYIPSVERIGIYANARNILHKSPENLQALKALKLGIIYLGLETGDGELLKKIQKGSTYDQLVQAARRVKDSGIALSVTVLLGIGGVEGSRRHAAETARILTDMDPMCVARDVRVKKPFLEGRAGGPQPPPSPQAPLPTPLMGLGEWVWERGQGPLAPCPSPEDQWQSSQPKPRCPGPPG